MRNPRRFRPLAALLATASIVALVAAGCGGGDDNSSPKNTLASAFSPDGIGKLTSGNLDVKASVGISNGGDPAKTVTLGLTGPFDDHSSDLKLTAGGVDPSTGKPVNFEAGLTVTADNAFVNYQGTEYELGADRYAKLKSSSPADSGSAVAGALPSSFAEGCKQAFKQAGAADNAACDQVDPTAWATLESDGSADVGGTETDHYSGQIDTTKLFTDVVDLVLAGLPASQRSQVPTGILQQIPDFIESADISVDVGKDDAIPRKGEFTLKANVLGQEISTAISAEVDDANQPQTITAPTGAQPIEKLRDVLPAAARGAFDCFLNAQDAASIQGCAKQLQSTAVPAASVPL
jgi:hypothetical protein